MSKNGVKTVKIPCVGYDIVADWYEGKSDQVLLVVPGWASSKQKYESLTNAITEQTGSAALVVDLAGHGDSPFRLPDLMPAQNLLDLMNAYDWLRREHPDKTVNVMGASYGSYLAAWLAAYRPISRLVLRAPAIYRPEDMYVRWGDIDREATRLEYRAHGKTVAAHPVFAAITGFKGRTLVVIHELDEEIPAATSDAYIKAFHADKYVAEAVTHRMTEWMSERSKVQAYQKAIADWLR